MRILVAYPDEVLFDDISYRFDEQDELDYSGNIKDALSKVKQKAYDFCLLGVSFSDGTGLDYYREASEIQDIPTIALSDQSNVKETILFLEYGCDDYMEVPFDILELRARMRAVMRRCKQDSTEDQEENQEIYTVQEANLELNVLNRQAYYQGKNLELTGKEFDLLLYLMMHKSQAIPREELAKEIWGEHQALRPRSVDVNIKRLREKLAISSIDHYIQTKWGEGYIFSPHAKRD